MLVVRTVTRINVYFMSELPVPTAVLICYVILLYESIRKLSVLYLESLHLVKVLIRLCILFIVRSINSAKILSIIFS